MIEQLASFAAPILEFPLIRRLRRNHGLEHATIHMLSRRTRNLKVAGRADESGFFLYGDIDTDAVRAAAEEALHRMKSGEHRLAVHPNCGTNLVITSLMTSSAAILGLWGVQPKTGEVFNRLPLVMLLSIVALITSQPAGLSLQRYITTNGEPADLEIVDITRHESHLPLLGHLVVHRVHTQYG